MPATNEILKGRYRIVSQLGQNGTGPVYEAFDENLKTRVIVREIPVKLNKVTTPAQMEILRTAFAGEAEALARITHGAFILIRDHFSEVGQHFLVMEAVDGEYLSELMEKHGAFPVSQVAQWADHLLDGLNYLHTQSPAVIHSDIKPGNIKLTSANEVKLLALSVASDPGKGSSITERPFDATSLHYSPLEQIWGNLDLASQKVIAGSYDETSGELLTQPPDAHSDIFALGATLYHLLTGQRPVDALERSIDILEGKPDPLATPTKLAPSVPPEISYVVMKAMEIRREKRFESALIMRQVLKTAAIRAKEREAQEMKKQQVIAAPEIRLPEPKEVSAAHAPSPVKDLDGEVDPQRQLELIKARLLEAENKRQLAEQRATEAERRLQEREISISQAPEESSLLEIPAEPKPAAVLKVVQDDMAQVLEMPEAAANIAKHTVGKRHSKEIEFSFTQPAESKNFPWKMLAAAAVLIVAVGGGFAVWTFMSSNAAGPAHSIPTPVMSLNEPVKTEPAAENTPAPAAETASQTSTEITAPAENSAAVPNNGAANSPAIKARPAVQIAKQTPAAAKTPAKQKKAVTVDDLINDN